MIRGRLSDDAKQACVCGGADDPTELEARAAAKRKLPLITLVVFLQNAMRTPALSDWPK
jgi:hypothetical protein